MDNETFLRGLGIEPTQESRERRRLTQQVVEATGEWPALRAWMPMAEYEQRVLQSIKNGRLDPEIRQLPQSKNSVRD
jgi:hypothetical protein